MKDKNKNIIVIVLALCVLVCLIIIKYVFFSTTYGLEQNKFEYGTYENAQNIIKEVLKSYYIRGPFLQYNNAKNLYLPPEDATSQDTQYTVCGAFVYTVYSEAFGLNYSTNPKFPLGNSSMTKVASEYYNENKNNIDKLDGSFLLYYENTTPNNTVKYVYTDPNNNDSETDFEKLVNSVKPGDMFTYTGHALIAYDVAINPNTGKLDVLLLNSWRKGIIRSRITTTSNLSYNIFPSFYGKEGKNEVIDVDKEGTIQWIWLSDDEHFVIDDPDTNEKKLSCSMDECQVTRVFYEDEDGKAIFNYNPSDEYYKKSELRLKFPGLLIEKITDVGDNNSVYKGDKFTYKIKVTNKSTVTYNGTTYAPFYIEETIDDNVDYISSTMNAEVKKNTLKWSISKLQPDETVELTYTVKVKENIENEDNEIISIGKFYTDNDTSSISTGTVKHTILSKISEPKKSYEECFNNIKNNNSIEGLELIDEVYKCAREKDFKFRNFDFDNIILTIDGPLDVYNKPNVIKLNKTNSDDDIFINMILNNYWGGIRKYCKNDCTPDTEYMHLPSFQDKDSDRARTINSIDFKDGDVLIYYLNNIEGTIFYDRHSRENGIYAYIYINGEFVGNNNSDSQKIDRQAFNYNYYPNHDKPLVNNLYSLYDSKAWNSLTDDEKEELLKYANYQTLFVKDNYVILRPEVVIKEYIVNFDLNDSQENIDPIHVFDGDTIDLPIPTREGYTFKEWQLNGKTYDFSKPVTNNITLTAIWEENLNTILKNNGYVINNNYISKFTLGDTITQIKNKLGTGVTIESKTSIISTGTVIKKGNESYTVVIKGDLTGDGKVNSGDLLQMRKYLLEEVNLDGAYKEAGIIESVGNIKSLDLLRIRQYLLGEYNFS